VLPVAPCTPCGPTTLPASTVVESVFVIIKRPLPSTAAELNPTPVAPCGPMAPVAPVTPCIPCGPTTLPTLIVVLSCLVKINSPLPFTEAVLIPDTLPASTILLSVNVNCKRPANVTVALLMLKPSGPIGPWLLYHLWHRCWQLEPMLFHSNLKFVHW